MTADPVNLFGFLELVAIAQARKILPAQRGSVALLIAMDGKGTTGDNCVVDTPRLAAELGLSERQVWRHVAQLVDDGWLQQTVKAAPGGRHSRGRRARYRLTQPRIVLSHERLPEPTEEASHDRMPEPTAARQTIDTSDTPENVTRSPRSDPERLTFSAQSSDIGTPELGTLPTSVGPTYPSSHLEAQPQVARELDLDVKRRADEVRAAMRRSR